jgi:hypothetical protein
VSGLFHVPVAPLRGDTAHGIHSTGDWLGLRAGLKLSVCGLPQEQIFQRYHLGFLITLCQRRYEYSRLKLLETI